ncbi:MAG: hypothetical protein U9Q30_01515 [Campylobacterota bacterium]|nr:hypothetical protein [Campylobacterota bacterium]
MERRNRSLKAFNELKQIDSYDGDFKAEALLKWVDDYISDSSIEEFDLDLDKLKIMSELFYKNIRFLKDESNSLKQNLNTNNKIQAFLQ